MKIKDRLLNRIINRDVSHLLSTRSESLKEDNDFIVQLIFDNDKNFTIKQYYMQSKNIETDLYVFSKAEKDFKLKAIERVDKNSLQQDGFTTTYKAIRESLIDDSNKEYLIKRNINDYIFEVKDGSGRIYNSYIDYIKMSEEEKPVLLKDIVEEILGGSEHFYGWVFKKEEFLNIYLKEEVEMPIN